MMQLYPAPTRLQSLDAQRVSVMRPHPAAQSSRDRTTFPTIYSSLSPQALISEVLSSYDIDRVIACQFWNRGLSDVYLVQTISRSYILRVSHHHWRSRSDVYFELEFLAFCRDRCLPIAYPLRTTDNRLAVEINAPEGERYAALFVFAEGDVPLGDVNPQQSQLLGETLARLHESAHLFRSRYHREPLSLEYLFDRSLDTIAPFFSGRNGDRDYLENAVAESKAALETLPQSEPYWTICWGDPHSGNAHFTPDGRVTLFDFDQCGYGWRAFDVAKFLHIALRTGISRHIRDAFLRGYESVSPLDGRETQMFQPLTQAAHLWSWAIAVNNTMMNNYSRLDHSYFSQRLEQLKLLRSSDWGLF
ncbi:MAG: phosphotransferase [Phormidium sp.]